LRELLPNVWWFPFGGHGVVSGTQLNKQLIAMVFRNCQSLIIRLTLITCIYD